MTNVDKQPSQRCREMVRSGGGGENRRRMCFGRKTKDSAGAVTQHVGHLSRGSVRARCPPAARSLHVKPRGWVWLESIPRVEGWRIASDASRSGGRPSKSRRSVSAPRASGLGMRRYLHSCRAVFMRRGEPYRSTSLGSWQEAAPARRSRPRVDRPPRSRGMLFWEVGGCDVWKCY